MEVEDDKNRLASFEFNAFKNIMNYNKVNDENIQSIKLEEGEDPKDTLELELKPNDILNNNPWAVSSLTHFLMYNCPECEFKISQENEFFSHAIENHPKAQAYFVEHQEQFPFDFYDDVANNSYDLSNEFCENIDDTKVKNENDIQQFDNLDDSEHRKRENEIHKCDFCTESFSVPGYLFKHIKKWHGGQKINNCESCGKSFYTKHGLKNHVKKVHTGIKKYNCSLCNSGYNYKLGLKQHIATFHEGQKNFKCSNCEKAFTTSAALKIHIESVHEEIRHECDVCGISYTQLPNLRNHIKAHHKAYFDEIVKHEEFVKEIERSKREEQKSLKKQTKKVHEGEKEFFHCDHCEQTYCSKTSLRKHVKKIHGEDLKIEKIKAFFCEHCGKKVSSKKRLETHIAKVHITLKEDSLICDICGKSYGSLQLIEYHKKSVHGEKKFVCNHCGSAFSHKGHFNKHVRRMHEKRIKDKKCDLCDKAFYEKEQLIMHKKVVHEDHPRSQICKLCGKAFKKSNHLMNHIRGVHEGMSWKEVLKRQTNKVEYKNKTSDEMILPH